MRLILIDSRIIDITSISESFTDQTEHIVFDFFTDTISSIKDKIVSNYESVAIIQHNYSNLTYQLVSNSEHSQLIEVQSQDPNLDTWQEYIDFLAWLKIEKGAEFVDLLACNLWADENWKYMIETVRTRDGVHIRASIDITGDGGNFVLESDGVDTIGMYFTEGILDYKYAFYNYGINLQQNYLAYTLPSTNPATISSTYTSMTGGSFNETNVISMYTNGNAIACLKTDNSISLLGSINYGGGIYTTTGTPTFTFSLSDLTNVKKVVNTWWGFCILKNNGSVFCWGGYNIFGSTYDINNIPNTIFINFNSVKADLQSNVVDIVASNDSFAALTSTGKVVLWGVKNGGADPLTDSAFLLSGVSKIYYSANNFFALKADNTGLWTGLIPTTKSVKLINNLPISTSKIIDVFLIENVLYLLVQNQSTSDITLYDAFIDQNIYTIPSNVKIIKTASFITWPEKRFIALLSNNTLLTYTTILINPKTVTSNTITNNVYDLHVNNYAYSYILKNTVNNTYTIETFLDANSGGSSSGTYGIVGSRSITSPVRLIRIGAVAFGVIQSDNTFVWWGRIGFSSEYSKSILHPNQTNIDGTNIRNVYPLRLGFIVATKDTSNPSNPDTFYELVGNTNSITPNGTVKFLTKGSNNVKFEVYNTGTIALEIPYNPSVSPTSITQNVPTSVSYYVSNPDLIGYVGRTYKLYYGASPIDTFIPAQDTHTYVFSNVNITYGYRGPITLTIKDATIPEYTYTVVDFSINLVPPISIPDTPILTSILSGNATLSVYFNTSVSNGGSPLLNYYYSTNGSTYTYTSVPSGNVYTIPGLINGNSYSVILKSTNAIGNSNPSNMLSGIPYTVPGAPTINSLTSGNTIITANVSAPTSTGGNAITKYYYNLNGGSTYYYLGTVGQPQYSIPDLTNGNSYSITIIAENTAGNSSPSSSLTAIPYTVPGAPIIKRVIPKNEALDISFVAPLSDGGNAITDYKYSFYPDSSYNSLGSIPITYSIAELTNGTQYTIYMKATNAAGNTITASSALGTPAVPIAQPEENANIPNIISMRSAFSNNLVYYKPGSLSSSGGGSGVANSRAKQRRT